MEYGPYGQTELEAIDTTIELWKWMHKTGSSLKFEWPGFEGKDMESSCPLCQYAVEKSREIVKSVARCNCCPMTRLPWFDVSPGWRGVGCMSNGSEYLKWTRIRTVLGNKRAAGRFLKQLYQIREVYLEQERLGREPNQVD